MKKKTHVGKAPSKVIQGKAEYVLILQLYKYIVCNLF